MRALLAFAPLFRPHLKSFALTLLLSLVTLAAGVALLGVSGWFLTATALTAVGVSFNIFAPSAAVRGLSFIRILARYGEKLTGHNSTLKLLSDMRQWLFTAMFPRLPLGSRHLRHGDLVSRLTADVDALDTLFLVVIGPLLTVWVIGATLAAVLHLLLPGAFWLYLAPLIGASLVVPIVLVLTTQCAGARIVAVTARMRAEIYDTLVGHDDIVLFGQQQSAKSKFDIAAQELAKHRRRLGWKTAAAGFTVQLLTGAALLGTLVAGLGAQQTGEISGPLLAGILLAILGSFEASAVIIRSVGKFGNALAAAERLREVATGPVKIVECAHPIVLPSGGAISISNLCFNYGSAPILENVDLEIAEGEHVAITGPSGSGKSTLLNVMLRLVEPTDGQVQVAGTSISEVALKDLHAHITLLSQDSPVFLDSIRNNLLIARPDASETSMWATLEKARLAEFVRQLPDGLDTMIGEQGSRLSAGQARRLCLARTLLSPATIVLLDEPTAGLDRETELEFFDDFDTTLAGRTAVLVTHAGLPENSKMRRLVLRAGKLEQMP